MKVHAPKTKLTPRERRHSKQVATLNRWHKKRESAIKTLAKSERIIPRLEKALQRYDKLMAFSVLGKTEPTVEAPTPEVKSVSSAGLDIPEFLRRDKVEPPTWNAFERHKGGPAVMVKLKAPRKRKPKANDPLVEMIG